MATSPVADARTASPAPEEARPAEETVAENLLMAEMDSLVKMMADVSKIPEENKGTLHFVPESDDSSSARRIGQDPAQPGPTTDQSRSGPQVTTCDVQNGRLSWPSFVGTEPKFREAEEGDVAVHGEGVQHASE